MHSGWSHDGSHIEHLQLLLAVDAPRHVDNQAVQRLGADTTVLDFDWEALPEPWDCFRLPQVEQQVAGLLHGIGQKPAEVGGEIAHEAEERSHGHEYIQAYERDSVVTEVREHCLAQLVVEMYIRSPQPAVGFVEYPRYSSH